MTQTATKAQPEAAPQPIAGEVSLLEVPLEDSRGWQAERLRWYRHAKVNANFIPGGETLNDASVKLDWLVRRDLSISAFVQCEQWKAPLLAPTSQTNWTSSVELSFQPQKLFRRSASDALGGSETTALNGAQP